MKRSAAAACVLLLFFAGSARATVGSDVRAVFESLPLAFEANTGKFDKRVKFIARTPGKTLFVVPEGMVFVLDQSSAPDTVQAILRMEFWGAARKGIFQGVDRLAAKTNYFSEGVAITDVPNFARVQQQGVYGGIDVIYYGNQGRLEYDFIVSPGADPARIRLRLSGQKAAHLSRAGDLVLQTVAGELVMKKPMAYQDDDGARKEIGARYVLKGNEVSFALASYDRSRALVIDPLLVYSTFIGGSGDDRANAIALDSAGNIYIAGQTDSTDFPRVNAFQTKKAGVPDAFVTKLNAAGSAIVYSTYLGGKTGGAIARGIAVDGTGSAYVTGYTYPASYPTTSGAYRTSGGSSNAGFVTKLAPLGNALAYSTYIPSGEAWAIALDPTGSALVTGQATTAFETTAGAVQPNPGGGLFDAYVLRLNPAGTAALYATRLGGLDDDTGHGIALDAAGHAYVAGQTRSSDFPTLNAYQPLRGGEIDAFVAKIDPTGASVVYSTYLGGSLRDWANAIAVDAQGNAHMAGTTYSLDFPVLRAFQPSKALANASVNQAFIAKLDASGQSLAYSSYLGGQSCVAPGGTSCLPAGNDETALAIAVDAAGIAYIAGQARSVTFPQVEPIQTVPSIYGQPRPFVAKVREESTATLLYSVALGEKDSTRSGVGRASGIALDAAGNVLVAGAVVNAFPITPGALQYFLPSCCNAKIVVFKFGLGAFPTSLGVSNAQPTSADPLTLTAFVTGGTSNGEVNFRSNGNVIATVPVSEGRATFTTTLAAGVHELTAVYTGDNKVSRAVFLPVKQASID
jgi:hypothetical protein